MEKYIGIDYGYGKTNIDLGSGIRYGVISLNSVLPEALDDFETIYPDTDGLSDTEIEYLEPLAFTYEKDGYKLEYSPDSTWLWVFKSPYTTKCMFCSPCVPGAGDLDNPEPDGIETYCLGPDWFENETAPYIIKTL